VVLTLKTMVALRTKGVKRRFCLGYQPLVLFLRVLILLATSGIMHQRPSVLYYIGQSGKEWLANTMIEGWWEVRG